MKTLESTTTLDTNLMGWQCSTAEQPPDLTSRRPGLRSQAAVSQLPAISLLKTSLGNEDNNSDMPYRVVVSSE